MFFRFHAGIERIPFDMKESTKQLHASLIRALKAVIAAWERWLKEQDQDQ